MREPLFSDEKWEMKDKSRGPGPVLAQGRWRKPIGSPSLGRWEGAIRACAQAACERPSLWELLLSSVR